MKKLYLLIVLIAVSYNIQAKSSEPINGKYFSKIDASGVLKIHLVKSDSSYMNIKQNPENKRTVNYYVKGNTLYIASSPRKTVYIKKTINGVTYIKNEIDIELGVQAIDEISLKNASSITSNFQLKGDNISLELENASSANLDINCKKITLNMHDASSAAITGTANDFYVYSEDASSIISNSQLQADNIFLQLSDASSTNLNVNCKKITSNMTDASSAEITGKADSVYFSCKEASSLRALQLENTFANVKLSNSSSAKLNTNSTTLVIAELDNTSSIKYTKEPIDTITMKVTKKQHYSFRR